MEAQLLSVCVGVLVCICTLVHPTHPHRYTVGTYTKFYTEKCPQCSVATFSCRIAYRDGI